MAEAMAMLKVLWMYDAPGTALMLTAIGAAAVTMVTILAALLN